jgi:signal peptidase I
MWPTLASGDRLLVRRGKRGVAKGRIVVLWRDAVDTLPSDAPGVVAAKVRDERGRSLVVKRVAATPGDAVPKSVRAMVGVDVTPEGALVVLGDNTVSADSRDWGFVSIDALEGVAILSLSLAGSLRDVARLPARGNHPRIG